MTKYLALSDASLTVGKAVVQSVMRALRDNVLSIIEGDDSAPRINPRSMDSPYFYARRTTDHTVPTPGGSTWKVAYDTEVYDPDGCYDNTASGGNGYRFVPNKPGVYLVTHFVQLQAVPSAAVTILKADIRKNGAIVASAAQGASSNANGSYTSALVTALVQMNGSTDYLEGWVNDGVSSGIVTSNPVQGYFTAVGICQI